MTNTIETIARHFAPGNVIHNAYWRRHDRVIAFRVLDSATQSWVVTVERVENVNGMWIAVESPRKHATAPSKLDRIVA